MAQVNISFSHCSNFKGIKVFFKQNLSHTHHVFIQITLYLYFDLLFKL